ncbi:diguanylate cyclase [Hydrogenimonas sp. SS33]|uniref:diguanylate cyclase n=1 Tax=Hydrogenimonas leucolamina TaxID=2954236 RepID=UPI00336BC784
MDTRRKLSLFTFSLLILFAVAIMINAAVNFRSYAYRSSIEKAKLAAEFVRDGLTAHMVNHMMDKRATFLQTVSQTKNLKTLWVVRGKPVIDQFGPGLHNEKPRDDTDRKVLEKGKMVTTFDETTDHALLRVTIPYIATAYGSPDCLSCHKVNEGDVLGAVSIEMEISDIRREGILTLLKIALITAVFVLLALMAVQYLMRPYLSLFQQFQTSLKEAMSGDFSHRITTSVKTKDIREIADLYNRLIDKFQATVGSIEKKLAILLKNPTGGCSTDPLETASHTIEALSQIQLFKHTIEQDRSLDQIYLRIAAIVKSIMKTEKFIIYGIDTGKNSRELLFSTVEGEVCHPDTARECRAFRIDDVVDSTQFEHLCPCYTADYKGYFCMPLHISESYLFLFVFLADDGKTAEGFKQAARTLMNYLENAKPVIESRLLMAQLEAKSLKDGLTGLYNRKFLEEFMGTIEKQVMRDGHLYGIMMLDLDHFKEINDTYGHDVGDRVIRLLAETVRENIRASDIPIRYGGEEFLIFLHNTTVRGTRKVAETIRQRFRDKTVTVKGEEIPHSVSIGVAFYPAKGVASFREAIKMADMALYRAKHEGRNRVAVTDETSRVSEDSAPE